MASGSNEVVDLEFAFDASFEKRSIRELISALKYGFRESDFARVESILIQREEKLKEELQKVNESLKYERESSRLKKMEVEKRCEELQQLNTQPIQEKNEILERERKAVDAAEMWKKKYEGLKPRILKLEDAINLLSTVKPNARVSSENGNYAETKIEVVNVDVVEKNADFVRVDMDRPSEDNRGRSSRIIIELSDSDDDRCLGEILSKNRLTSQRVADSDCSSQTDARRGTRWLKRKRDSCPNVNENKCCFSGSVEAENEIVDGALTADCKKAKVQKSIHGNDDSLANHCSEKAISSRNKSVEKFCPTSGQVAEILRRCEEKLKADHISKNHTRESLLNVTGVCNSNDSSSSSSSSSDSESNSDLNFDFSAYKDHK